MVGHGWAQLGTVGHGWAWLGTVGHGLTTRIPTHHPPPTTHSPTHPLTHSPTHPLTHRRYNTFEVSSKELSADHLYDLRLEYRESQGAAMARLFWRSESQPLEIVPSHRLFHRADDVMHTPYLFLDSEIEEGHPLWHASDKDHLLHSPYQITPMPVEPLRPVDISLEIGAWDEIVVSWDAPHDDGGSAIDKYRVEWWSADTGLYGAKEVQTLKFADEITGGVWYLTSPSGSQYHSPLAWNATTLELELAIESFADVGDVSVVFTHDTTDQFREYVLI